MDRRYYIPAALIVEGEKVREPGLDTMLATIYYYLVSRRREGLIVGAKNVIRAVGILYYPFKVVEVLGKYAAIIDPIMRPIYSTVFNKPLLEDLYEKFSVLSEARGRAFIEELRSLKSILQSIYDERESTVSKRYEVRGLVHNKNVVEELSMLMSIASEKGLPGLVLPEKEVDIDDARRVLEEILEETGKVIDQLTAMTNTLDQHYEQWRKRAEEEHEARKKEVEREVDLLKKVIDERIGELRRRLEEEKARIEEKYLSEERELEEKIRGLRGRIEGLESEAIEERRDELKRLKKELKRLEKRLEGIRRLKRREMRRAELRTTSIIRAENARKKHLEEELERFSKELERLISRASVEVEALRKSINRIISQVMSVRNSVTSILTEIPSLGAGDYLVPFIAILYSSPEGAETIDVIPLIKLVLSRTTLLKQVRIIETPTLQSRASRLKIMAGSSEYRKRLYGVNLLDKKYVGTAEKGFEKLVRSGFISSSEAYEALSTIESYIEA